MDIETIEKIRIAVNALQTGNLVAFPTETVYGLGADALNIQAVKRLYLLKKRPTQHPLIIHISNYENLDFWIENRSKLVDKLLADFTPGPLTLIFKKKQQLEIGYFNGNQDTVAIRIPKILKNMEVEV
jgi:L-threonylcarbamoyladenylate synthase